MTNFKFLLIGTSLSFLPTLSYAQCVATQDCTTLGYTETSCNGGKGVKCPFGNTWACLEECSDCAKLGFTYECKGTGEKGVGQSCNGKYQGCSCDSSYQYTCSGTGYAGGTGSACGGKYTQCSCSNGYEWKNGSCQQQILHGAVGDLYYCNGLPVAAKTSDLSFWISLHDQDFSTWPYAEITCNAYNFCDSTYGRLPTLDELKMIYQKKSILNKTLQLTNDYYWASTRSTNTASMLNMSTGEISSDYGGTLNNSHYVRCVF